MREQNSQVMPMRPSSPTMSRRSCGLNRRIIDMMRSREQRREEPLEAGPWGAERLPDPVVGPAAAGDDPETAALTADSVGWALMVVVQELNPLERVAFVLHDLFAVPYTEIGPLVERSEDAARQQLALGEHEAAEDTEAQVAALLRAARAIRQALA